MANRGSNTNSSQFFITVRPTPHLDGKPFFFLQTVICSQEFITRTSIVFCNSGKHVVFGRIVSGYDVVKAIESTPVDDNDRPIGIVMIAQCGELELKLPPNYKGNLTLVDYLHLTKNPFLSHNYSQSQRQKQTED